MRYCIRTVRKPGCPGQVKTTNPSAPSEFYPFFHCVTGQPELKETLAVTLREALEFNRKDSLSAAGAGTWGWALRSNSSPCGYTAFYSDYL